MTRLNAPPKATRERRPGTWLLQDAKARFSELVRLAKRDGPQHVMVHGRDAVVVMSTADFDRLKNGLTGEALIAALQASPDRDVDIMPARHEWTDGGHAGRG
jgi:prevent-host-death family protein